MDPLDGASCMYPVQPCTCTARSATRPAISVQKSLAAISRPSGRAVPGLYFEEFEPRAVIDHATRRTVTEMDNVLFSSLTLNLAPLHLDAEYGKDTVYGQRLLRLAPISQEMVLNFVSTSVLGLPRSY